MPFVRGTKQNIIGLPTRPRGGALILVEVIIPVIAHRRHHPAEMGAVPIVREKIAVIRRVHAEGDAPLFFVADAERFLRLRLGFGQRGQQHSSEDRDDRDHDEEFNQRERTLRGAPGEQGLFGLHRPNMGKCGPTVNTAPLPPGQPLVPTI